MCQKSPELVKPVRLGNVGQATKICNVFNYSSHIIEAGPRRCSTPQGKTDPKMYADEAVNHWSYQGPLLPLRTIPMGSAVARRPRSPRAELTRATREVNPRG